MPELADIGMLQAFIAVVEAGSFGVAAVRVGLTRSAVGKSVARLEALLGVRLLHRTTRRVGLTVDGRAFHERALAVLKDLEDAQTSVARGRATPRGTLRLTTTETFGRQILLPVLGDYLERWPDLIAEASFTDRFIDLIEEGFDLAIRFGPPPSNSDLISRVIARSFGQLYASSTYLRRHGVPSSIEELTLHKKLVFDTGLRPRVWEFTKNAGKSELVSGDAALLSDNAGALLDAAISGLGITCLPRFLVQKHVDAGQLEIVLPSYTTLEIPISAVYPSRRHLTPKVRLFIDALAERLNDGLVC